MALILDKLYSLDSSNTVFTCAETFLCSKVSLGTAKQLSSSPALVIQTQGDIDDTPILGSDDEDNCTAVPSDTLEHGEVAAQVNYRV